ncbi:hypothetical protein ASE00_03015 [Sphingomonas sp. Root710]|nr:hypothetical protein ASE00_03015 [Sphingomonas sp. Root710]
MMSDTSETAAAPNWFMAVGVLFLLWGLAGIYAFYSQLTTPYEQLVAQMGKAGADCIAAMPQWLWWVYGVAVWSGTFGSVALLLRRAWAQPLYLLSLAAVIIQFGHSFGVAKIQDIMGWGAAAFPAFIIAMAIIELWFATSAKKKGWIV